MSRSKHTRPDRILAASRVRAPYEARGQDDQSSFRRLARVLKESGIIVNLPNSSESGEPIIPRIIAKRPRQGFVHPAEKSDILRVLQFFGERCFYGLRLIKLIQGSAPLSGVSLLMGRLEVPGTIVLYDQPASPWFVAGSISSAEKEKLERAGASIEVSSDNLNCLIHWTDSDLKNFMLFEVFLMELTQY